MMYIVNPAEVLFNLCVKPNECYSEKSYILDSVPDLVTIKASLSPEMRQDESVKHALDIQAAFATKNYHRFFKLYAHSPKMSGYLIDWFIERVRKEALKIIVKSYVYLSSWEGGSKCVSVCLCIFKRPMVSKILCDCVVCPISLNRGISFCILYFFSNRPTVSLEPV